MQDYTHITIILDRTGSMESIRDDTIGGFNAFLKQQKDQPGKATLTLVQFDTQDPYEVIHHFAPISDVPELTRETYVPRASTPLLDAMGRGINDLEHQLSQVPESDRPDRIVMAVVTDGQENSSREFRREQIVKMIDAKKEKANWQFVFLSADLSSINDAQTYGMHADATMAYDRNAAGVSSAWLSLSQAVSTYRQDVAQSIAFTEEDRNQQESEKKRKKS